MPPSGFNKKAINGLLEFVKGNYEITLKKYGKLTPGTIYPALKSLRENKLINFKQKGRKNRGPYAHRFYF